MRDSGFAERFKQAVCHAGVEDTQEALGKLLGVSSVTIWSYRNGDKLPRMKKAAEIAQALGVNVNWLMTGSGAMVNVDQLSEAERELLRIYRSAEPEDQEFLARTFRLLAKKDSPA